MVRVGLLTNTPTSPVILRGDAMSDDRLKNIEDTVNDIHRRLFIDNGNPCIQTRINKHEAIINVIAWATGTACAAAIIALVGLVIR